MNSSEKKGSDARQSRDHKIFQAAVVIGAVSVVLLILYFCRISPKPCFIGSFVLAAGSMVMLLIQKDNSLAIFIAKVVATLVMGICLVVVCIKLLNKDKTETSAAPIWESPMSQIL
ncbi:MAG: hypothetical protein HUJ55_07750 [Ileibacterium sp.]|nr:hypothetical protein [Ileibacterium sp.]